MKNSAGKMLLGTIIGGAIGAIAGIMFAPDKGSVTRKKITDKAKETSDNIKETVTGKYAEVKEYVSEKLDKKKNHNGSPEYHEETAGFKSEG